MVALAEWIEKEESAVADPFSRLGETATPSKNRIRRFFSESPDRVGDFAPQVVDRVGEAEGVGYESRLGYVLDQKENPKPKDKTDCEKTVDLLVQNAERAQSGYEEISQTQIQGFGPYGSPGASFDAANGYVAGVGMRLSKLGYDLYKNNEMINPVTGSAGKSEVTGFRNELVASGQNSDAIRHVFMTAGGGLSGTPFSQVISGAMNAYDGYQANVLRRAESAAELAGNIAGHDAGKAMRSFALGHTSDSASLRQTLMDRLCQ